jgi:hypothetical protein
VSYSYEIWNMFLGEINIHSGHNRVYDGRMLVSDSCYWSLIKRLQNGCPLFVWANCGYVLFFMTF